MAVKKTKKNSANDSFDRPFERTIIDDLEVSDDSNEPVLPKKVKATKVSKSELEVVKVKKPRTLKVVEVDEKEQVSRQLSKPGQIFNGPLVRPGQNYVPPQPVEDEYYEPKVQKNRYQEDLVEKMNTEQEMQAEMKIRAAQQERARQKNLEKTMASRKRAEVEEEPVTYVAPRIVGKKKILTVKNIKIVGLALVVILLLFAYVPQLKKAANNTISFLQYGSGYPDTDPRELNRILMLLQKHILVPKSPANLVTLKDTATLSKNQPFLSDAKDGDKLIVFPALHQAILYSPARDIIVNVGAVSQENDTNTNTAPAPSNAASSTQVAAAELSVEIRNGTKVPGMAGKLKTQLSGQGFNVINASTDPISTYTNTEIFAPNVSESRKAELQKLVSDLQAQIVYKLPTGEANTSADILIIYGAKSP